MINSDVRAVVFDKDGTLVDFDRTYTPAVDAVLRQMSGNDPDLLEKAAIIFGYDLGRRQILPSAPFKALSNAQLMDSLAPVFGHSVGDTTALASFESLLAEAVPTLLVAATGANALLRQLRASGLRLAIATNDGEETTHEQLAALGWSATFDAVVGYDSGHGAKPEPDMVSACVEALGVQPNQTIMVGDSAADLLAARAAGVLAVFVGDDSGLTAMADLSIATIGDLADLIELSHTT